MNFAKELAKLKAKGLTIADCINALGVSIDSNPYAKAARGKSTDGGIEVDDTTVVSEGDDPGAYVLAWMWVSNEEAGILTNADLLEQVLKHARARLAMSHLHGLDADIKKLRDNQADWLEDLISNFADELDEIEDEIPKGKPGSITWTDGEMNEVRFMPSDALFQLLHLARLDGLPIEQSNQAEAFCVRYGNKLDAILTVIQTA